MIGGDEKYSSDAALAIPVTRVSDMSGGRGDLILQGNWYVPTVHKGNIPDRGGFPVGGWVSGGSASDSKPTRQQGFCALLVGG